MCSSDLFWVGSRERAARMGSRDVQQASRVQISRSEERRVGKSVDLGGRRIIKKKKRVL